LFNNRLRSWLATIARSIFIGYALAPTLALDSPGTPGTVIKMHYFGFPTLNLTEANTAVGTMGNFNHCTPDCFPNFFEMVIFLEVSLCG